GRSYGDLVKEFMQWLVQYNPDNQSARDVVFLRGVDFEGYNVGQTHRCVKIGNEALQIFDDQAIFVTVITAIVDRVHHNIETPEKRRDELNRLVLSSDDPPVRQLCIDSLFPDINWQDHKVITGDFNIEVPEPVPGKTLGQLLDVRFDRPGITECILGGYFVLFKPLPVGRHMVVYNGAGDNNTYRNQTFVEINVVPRGKTISSPMLFPNEIQSLTSIIEAKIKSGEISDMDIYYDALESLRTPEQRLSDMNKIPQQQVEEFMNQSTEQKEKLEKSRERAKKLLDLRDRLNPLN
ncbi:MAG TPA: hypothetical protein VFK40_01135, partial [Nitrososphaeraceae archaeon]|nr:hypothetical protein [Nitrososphaeraceae archaeon]